MLSECLLFEYSLEFFMRQNKNMDIIKSPIYLWYSTLRKTYKHELTNFCHKEVSSGYSKIIPNMT